MDVELAEALYCVGWLRPGQLQEVGLALLEANHYGPAIVELAQSPYSTWRDIGNLLDRAFAEAGRPPLSDQEAGMRVARYIADQIVSGTVELIEPIRGAEDEILILREHTEDCRLVVFASELGDYEYSEMRDETRRNIIRAAWDLLRT